MGFSKRPQLRMVWPRGRLDDPPEVVVAEGYSLRLFDPEAHAEAVRMIELMQAVGWEDWDEAKFEQVLQMVLPDGWFVVVDEKSGLIVAGATALHNYKGSTPFWGNLGWVGSDLQHRGKALGAAVTAAVVRRLIEAGYRKIDLYTEHYRPAAIKTYLKLGWVPAVRDAEHEQTWRECCEEVGWDFALAEWRQRAGTG